MEENHRTLGNLRGVWPLRPGVIHLQDFLKPNGTKRNKKRKARKKAETKMTTRIRSRSSSDSFGLEFRIFF